MSKQKQVKRFSWYEQKETAFWWLQVPGWLLLVYLVVAQGVSAMNYEWGVALGTQEPAEKISAVGTAFWYGFALADLLIYIPLLFAGLYGQVNNKPWWQPVLSAALGITVYWPVVCLAALVKARQAPAWNIGSELPYWIVCLSVLIWGGWAFIRTVFNNR